MISKTQINKRILNKRNPEIVETIEIAKKKGVLEIARVLSGPKRLYKKVNLSELEGVKSDKVLVLGKVLGQGEINKKMSVVALGFSEQAKEKLKKAGCDVELIKDELKNNPKIEGVEIL